ncbi:unnamed protein product [Durusdinium trenchii]|uniref:Phospholipid/glycerol acyltransferase domain-containing protein n=1 Tax=Durusdinium trenchii TaxID=1381693 RepID=A0ABP0I3L0_9DINO
MGDFRAEKEVVLAAVQHTGMALYYASPALRDDLEVVMAAVEQHWMALQYASEELRDDFDVGLRAVKANGLALRETGALERPRPSFPPVGPQCKDNANLVMEAVSNDGRALQYASENLRRDNFVVMEALKHDPEALEFADEELKDSLEVIMPALRRDGAVLRFLPDAMRDNGDVALDAVQTCGLAVAYASLRVRGDKEVILAAVRADGFALAYATQELQGDEDVVDAACGENPLALQYASDRWRCEKDFVKGVVGNDGLALEFVSGGLSNDKEVCMEAVSNTGAALIHCSAQLRDDDDIVRTAVNNDGLQFLHVSPRLRHDRDLLLLAVKRSPRALAHALVDQIHDQEVVRTAVAGDGMVLVWAPEELRDDEEVVYAAVAQNGLALEYASGRLRSKCEIVLAALGQNPEAFVYVMPGTRDDVRLMALGQARRPKLQEMLEERETGTLNWGDQRGFSEETLGKELPTALRMASARLRMFVEPLLQELKISWHDARCVFHQFSTLEDEGELQPAIDEPKAFLEKLRRREDEMIGHAWAIASARFSLEPLAMQQKLGNWEELVPVMLSCVAKGQSAWSVLDGEITLTPAELKAQLKVMSDLEFLGLRPAEGGVDLTNDQELQPAERSSPSEPLETRQDQTQETVSRTQQMEVNELSTLQLGPFEAGVTCEILRAWYGVAGDERYERRRIDATIHCRNEWNPTRGLTLSNYNKLFGDPAPLRPKRMFVEYRLSNLRSCDVANTRYESRLALAPVIAAKAVTNLVGVGVAGFGYAVGKVTTTVQNTLGSDTDAHHVADSWAFQAAFSAWLKCNGIVPSVSFEPIPAVPGRPKFVAEDMRQTPIILCNHVCYLDGMVLASVFHGPKIIAMKGTLNVPVIGVFAKDIGVIEVDRSDPKSRAATIKAIEDHVANWQPGRQPLLLFPEGTTSNGQGLLEFRKGAFVPGVPVRPAVLCYTGSWDPANTSYRETDGKIQAIGDTEWAEQFLGHIFHSLQIRVLPPYEPSEEEKADPQLYASNVRKVMSDAHAELRKEVELKAKQHSIQAFAQKGVDFVEDLSTGVVNGMSSVIQKTRDIGSLGAVSILSNGILQTAPG